MLAVVSVGVVLLCVIDALVLLHQHIHQLLCCVYLHNHSDGFICPCFCNMVKRPRETDGDKCASDVPAPGSPDAVRDGVSAGAAASAAMIASHTVPSSAEPPV